MKFIFFVFTALVFVSVGHAQAPKAPKPWESWDKYRQQMIEISEQLGVTCTFCHNTRNYRDNSKKEFQIAKKHIEMVDLLKKQFSDSTNDKINCYICHLGKAKIEIKKK